jgi:HK97 gp10 family phage protein
MVKIDIKGLDKMIADIEKMPSSFKEEVSGVLERGAQTFVRNAKRDAPVDHGALRNGISYFPNAPLSFQVASNAFYSAYLEWGTIAHVRVPAELQAYASEFKGKGLRKTGGIYPHPFFFKQESVVREQIEKGIEAVINDLEL